MKNSKPLLCTIAALFFGSQVLTASVVDTNVISTTSAWDGNNGIYYFGESLINDSSATFGQTITVGSTYTRLANFTFWINDSYPAFDNPINFAAYVMAWDGNKADGPILYQSGKLTTSNNGGQGGMEPFTFNTGGISLTPGGQYVLFISVSQFVDGDSERGGVGGVLTDAYPGGSFVNLGNGSNFGLLTTENWVTTPQWDLAFTATLSPAPEPSTILLGGAGLGLIWIFCRKSARQAKFGSPAN